MPFIQKITPPPNQRLDFHIGDYAGGINNLSHIKEDNNAKTSLNMAFSYDEIMEKRHGSTRLDQIDFNAPITYISKYRPYVGVDKLVRATDTNLYVEEDNITSISGRVNSTNFQGKLYFADGDALRVYGKFAQTTSTYQRVEGIVNPDERVMTVVSPPVGFTPLDTTHVQGVQVVNYTTNEVWYEPCQFELEDVNKGSNVVTTSVRYLVNFNGRIYASGSNEDDDNVFISDMHNPHYFPVYLPIQLPPNSDAVRGLVIYDNAVIIGREFDIYAIDGITNRTDVGSGLFTLRKINTHVGFASQLAMNVAHNYLFYLGSDGNVYSLGSINQGQRLLATQIINTNISFIKEPVGLVKEDFTDAVSYFFKDMWYLSMQDKVMVYSYRHRAWTMFDQLNIRSMYIHDQELIWGDTDGHTCKFSQGYLDKGVPFMAEWISKNFDMGNPSSFKHFREFFIVAHVFEEFHSDIRMEIHVDYENVTGDIVIQNQMSRWGISEWGDRFITRNINTSFPIMIGRRGRYIRFIFRNAWHVHEQVWSSADLDNVTEKSHNETLVYTGIDDKYHIWTRDGWIELEDIDYNQPMRVYEINGDYEMRGKR